MAEGKWQSAELCLFTPLMRTRINIILLQLKLKPLTKMNPNEIKTIRETTAAKQEELKVFQRHVVYPNGRQEFYDKNWNLHRDSGPAVIPINDPPEFWRHGELKFVTTL